MKKLFLSLLLLFTLATNIFAEKIKLPESLKGLKIAKEFTKNERQVVRYEHAPYYFYYLPCKKKNPPLRVMLHHAGGSGDKCLNESLNVKHRHQYASEEFAVLYLDCSNPKDPNWWWGWNHIKSRKEEYKDKLQVTEQRVLDTVQWIIQKYDINTNRVYLSGRSMGGSGSLGIGYNHGDTFAAMLVNVPAGAEHMLYRMKNSDYPDPPPTVNTSSHLDRWSRDQESLLTYCKENKLPMIFAWEPFGHKSRPNEANAAVYNFPWFDIVKNEAYPVFGNSSTDDTYPGFNNKTGENQRGQINAYYRWKNITDKKKTFTIELRLVKKDKLDKEEMIPQESIADVTLRRLQRFKALPGKSYKWRTVARKKVIQKGKIKANENGLLTIPQVRMTKIPVELQIK